MWEFDCNYRMIFVTWSNNMSRARNTTVVYNLKSKKDPLHNPKFLNFVMTGFQNAFDHNKAKKDGVIVPSRGRC